MRIFLILFLLPIIIYSSTNISIFAAADNSLYYTLNNNLESIRKGTENIDDITVFILADTPFSTYHIKIFNGYIDTLSVTTNINAGNSETVKDFFINSFNAYKADKNIVIMWSHGTDWYESKSILNDNNPMDYISIINGEFRNIFECINRSIGRKIDMIIFDACDMQSAEVLYELKDFVNVSIGSQIRSPYNGYPYESMMKIFHKESDIYAAGECIVESFFELYLDSLDSLQVSLVDITKINEIINDGIEYGIDSFNRTGVLDVSFPQEILSECVYNRTDRVNITGLKLFFPEDYKSFKYYYEDYIKLSIDNDYNIIKNEFPYYSTNDLIPPLAIDSFDIISKGYSNYQLLFNVPYDFNDLRGYNIDLIKIEDMLNYDFNDTIIPFYGDYSPYEYTSKPYSILTDTFYIDTTIPFSSSIISLNVKGMSDTSFVRIVSDYREDTLMVHNNRDWKTINGFCKGNSIKIIYSGKGDKAYFDDISIYLGNEPYNIFSSNNNNLFHKLEQGDYAVIVNAVDIKGNICNTGSIYEFTVIDPLKPYVYPNPASDFINIKTDIIGDYDINIFSSDGKNIINRTGQTDSGIIRIGFDNLNLKTGIYFFTINSKKGKFAITK